MTRGYEISVTRTIDADAERLLAAFTDPAARDRWLPDTPMKQRPTRAALAARFDWSDPPSRVSVTLIAKGARKATVTVAHEQLSDAAAAARFKSSWREWLEALKAGVATG